MTAAAQLDREINAVLMPTVYAAWMLGGSYKGKNRPLDTILAHAVCKEPIHIGRLKRDAGEAFCNKKYNTSTGNLSDEDSWESESSVTCPKCRETIDRIRGPR